MTNTKSNLPIGPNVNLFHYTDAHGLLGIITPPQLPEFGVEPPPEVIFGPQEYTFRSAAHIMASDVRFMNDTSELTFGATLVGTALEAAAAEGGSDSELRTAFQYVGAMLREGAPADWPWRCFAVSFCENDDLLSQWRGYAGGTGGFAIGFPYDLLAHNSHEIVLSGGGSPNDMMPAQSVPLQKVAYGKEDGEERAAVIVDALRGPLRSALVASVNASLFYPVAVAALKTAATIKHAAFDEEQEWRLVTVADRNDRTRVRARRGGLVPYRDIWINPRPSNTSVGEVDPAVCSIRVGPTRDPDGQKNAVTAALHYRNRQWLDHVRVWESGTPFVGN